MTVTGRHGPRQAGEMTVMEFGEVMEEERKVRHQGDAETVGEEHLKHLLLPLQLADFHQCL